MRERISGGQRREERTGGGSFGGEARGGGAVKVVAERFAGDVGAAAFRGDDAEVVEGVELGRIDGHGASSSARVRRRDCCCAPRRRRGRSRPAAGGRRGPARARDSRARARHVAGAEGDDAEVLQGAGVVGVAGENALELADGRRERRRRRPARFRTRSAGPDRRGLVRPQQLQSLLRAARLAEQQPRRMRIESFACPAATCRCSSAMASSGRSFWPRKKASISCAICMSGRCATRPRASSMAFARSPCW